MCSEAVRWVRLSLTLALKRSLRFTSDNSAENEEMLKKDLPLRYTWPLGCLLFFRMVLKRMEEMTRVSTGRAEKLGGKQVHLGADHGQRQGSSLF